MFRYLLERWRRRCYVKAMLKAIDAARSNVYNEHRPSSKATGLRVIRDFEKENKRRFNPFNELHIDVVRGMGPFKAVLVNLKRF